MLDGVKGHPASPVKCVMFLFFVLRLVAHSAVDLPPAEHVEEEFNLFLFGFLVVGVCIALFLFAVSVVIGIVAAVATIILVALGIVSSSVLMGLLHRRVSSGFRALHYQVCAVAAVPAGIGALWIGAHLSTLPILPRDVLIIGSIAGAGSGLLIAFAVDRLAGIACRRFARPSLPDVAGNA